MLPPCYIEDVLLLIRLGDGEFDAKSSIVCLCFFRFVHNTDFVPLRKVFEVTPLKSEPAQDGVKIVIIYSSSANVASISYVGRESHLFPGKMIHECNCVYLISNMRQPQYIYFC